MNKREELILDLEDAIRKLKELDNDIEVIMHNLKYDLDVDEDADDLELEIDCSCDRFVDDNLPGLQDKIDAIDRALADISVRLRLGKDKE